MTENTNNHYNYKQIIASLEKKGIELYGNHFKILEADYPIICRLIAYFLKDSFKNKDFIFEDFVKDADEIQEIRGLLYERYNNKPRSRIDAHHFHYHIFGKVLEEKVNTFANKYGLFVNID